MSVSTSTSSFRLPASEAIPPAERSGTRFPKRARRVAGRRGNRSYCLRFLRPTIPGNQPGI